MLYHVVSSYACTMNGTLRENMIYIVVEREEKGTNDPNANRSLCD